MGSWVEDRWVWDLRWRREPLEREADSIRELLTCAGKVGLAADSPDSWRWGEGDGGTYSVQKGYAVLQAISFQAPQNPACSAVKAAIWKTIAPFKFQIMAWRVVCNKLPTETTFARGLIYPWKENSVHVVPLLLNRPSTCSSIVGRLLGSGRKS